MGRKSKSESLTVWMNGQLVGRWHLETQGGQTFHYHADWTRSPYARPLSMSLPLQPPEVPHQGDRVKFFFENLLPDSEDIRKRVQLRYGATSTEAFQLLKEIGRDCVGAIQLLPAGETPKDIKRIKGIPLTPMAIEKNIQSHLKQDVFLSAKEPVFRFSLAGVQEKTAYLWHKKRWCIPVGITPSTHIFKLPLNGVGSGDYDRTHSVENEWVCSELLKAFGLNTSNCAIKKFRNQKVLVVERFDRKLSENGKWWLRIPMEDMCQAMGVSPLTKYENHGGPGIVSIMDFLLGSANAEMDRILFFKTQILFWLLAAPDGHAKNFSIFLEPGGDFQLTPLYDVLSAYPVMGKKANQIAPQKLKMAMYWTGKNRHDGWAHIRKRHMLATGKKCGLNPELVENLISDLKEKAPAVARKVSKKLSGQTVAVGNRIIKGLLDSTARL